MIKLYGNSTDLYLIPIKNRELAKQLLKRMLPWIELEQDRKKKQMGRKMSMMQHRV